jgi:ABC-type glycerol-3-phosphate transport system permease component
MKTNSLYRNLMTLFLLTACAFSLLPVVLMFLNSFKTGSELSYNSWRLPEQFTIENYQRLLSYNSGILMRTYVNAIFVAVSYTVLTLMISAMAAFAFSNYKFKGSGFIFMLLLATMMIPSEIIIPPLYIMFSKMKWLNTYQVQIIPGIANVFCMFMLKQYMDGLPSSIMEMARIDGAGHWTVFTRIVMPMAAPAIGAMAILVSLGKWNDYLWPKIMLTDPKVMPIMMILPTLNDKESVWSIPWELLMAGCSIVVIPLIIVFFSFQSYFMSSVTIGAVKE